MTEEESKLISPGLYKVTWKTGGESTASVGILHDGRRWIAPTNWTSINAKGICTASKKYWAQIESMELVDEDRGVTHDEVLDYIGEMEQDEKVEMLEHEGIVVFTSDSVLDEMKIRVLKEAFDKYSLEELESKLL